MTCDVCHENEVVDGATCRWCAAKLQFSTFAKECGLKRYPDPTGERYIYALSGSCDGKKIECVDFIDELWNALVNAKGGGEELLLRS